ncbi:MAG: hypothetical protein ACRDI2_23960, partial [Chloroflexota bacterium]
MRRIWCLPALALVLLAGITSLGSGGVAGRAQAQGAGCQYVLGFLALYQQIPEVMGECLEDETPAPNGDSLQRTANGLAVYRKADNWTAFTDGYRTWVNGPNGIQQRLNTERFQWEGDVGAPGTTTIPGAGAPAASSSFNPATVTVRLEPAIRGFTGPVYITHAGDGTGRLYVVERRGAIRLVSGGSIAQTPFLDIQPLVRSSGLEQG